MSRVFAVVLAIVLTGTLIFPVSAQNEGCCPSCENCTKVHLVTLNANGGKSTTSKKFTIGKKLSKLPKVTRAGYKFAGWYTAKSGGKKVTKKTKITKKATFYAHWKKQAATLPSAVPAAATPFVPTIAPNVTVAPTPTVAPLPSATPEPSDEIPESSDLPEAYNPQDFDPNNLRQSANEVIYLDDVETLTSSNETNVLLSAENGQYVFGNASDELRRLVPGDKFVIEPCDNFPQGAAVIVDTLNIVGDNVFIISREASMGDFVASMDVAELIPLTEDMIIEYGEGVTVYEDPAPALLRADAKGGSTPFIKKMKINPNMKGQLAIEGDISIALTLKADIDLREGWFNLPTGVDRFELSFNEDIQANFNFDASFEGQLLDFARVGRWQDGALVEKYANRTKTRADCKDYTEKLFTAAFPIATAPGLQATVTAFLHVDANGQISINAHFEQQGAVGFRYENKSFSPIKTNTTTCTVKGAADATIYAGVGLDIGVTYLKIATAALSPETGVKIKASTSFNETLIGISQTTPEPPIHDCAMCLDGRVELVLKIDLKFEALKALLKDPLWEGFLYDRTATLFRFYTTIGGETHGADGGKGACPYWITPSPSPSPSASESPLSSPSESPSASPSASPSPSPSDSPSPSGTDVPVGEKVTFLDTNGDGTLSRSEVTAQKPYSGYFGALIAPGVTSIGSGAFYGCRNLTIYGYTGSTAETYASSSQIPFKPISEYV